ncbi:MAG: Bor family protein [Gemmatimonadaceae bacterium]|nr:Bor family protein [Gemmatimonadaceae bacterium]
MRLKYLLFALPFAAACYHAQIETGLEPSPQKIEKPWAHGFVYGLVPPSTVETAAKCPSGVAKVETQQSFVNGLANLLTWGIYTPMSITVTCAAKKTASAATINAVGDPAKAVAEAAEKAASLGTAVFVQF